jgi:hypothetical protein
MALLDLKNIEMDTLLRNAGGVDILVVLDEIRERAIQFYPEVQYRQIDHHPVRKPDLPDEPDLSEAPVHDAVTGRPEGSLVDPLYNEPVALAEDGVWKQPHSDDAPNASNPRKHFPARPLRLYFRQEAAPSNDFRLSAMEEDWKGIIYTSLVLLDDAGIIMRTGDRFNYQGQDFEVLDTREKGRWGQTSIHLHIEATVKRFRSGS